jgi:hypothetical protein
MTEYREVISITHADGTVVRVTVESAKLSYAKHVAEAVREKFPRSSGYGGWREVLKDLTDLLAKGPKG